MIFSGSNFASNRIVRRRLGECGSPTALSLSNPSNGPALPVRHSLGEGGSLSNGPALSLSKGFTIVEVMMAATILVVGFMGMIQAITIGSEMIATAKRQTLAAQILEHEIGKLRLTAWSSLPAAGTATVTIDNHFTGPIAACGLTTSAITLARTTANIDPDNDGTADLKEVTFTLTWTKSGTTTAATAATGSWLDRLSFYRPSVISRTYTRKSTAFFGKYGLNLSTQRS